MNRVKLGWRVKDVVTNMTGIAVCKAFWLNGCIRILIQPEELHEGKPVVNEWFDIQQVEVVERDTKAAELHEQVVDIEDEPVHVEAVAGPRNDPKGPRS